jgi:hypothetical protein
MPEYMQYSEEWKAEMKKLPKGIIINIASQIGIEKQNEINVIKEQKAELLKALTTILSNFKSCISGGNGELKTDKVDIERAELAIKKATE